MANRMGFIVALALVVLVTGAFSMYQVAEWEKAILFRLGEIVKTDITPGLHFKLPFVNNVRKFDGRRLTLDVEPERPTRRVVGLAPDQQAAGGGPYRILVVDDSVENRELLRQMLEQVGFDVRTAVDGREAVEEYQRWEPHLIWMDIRMPVMDGYQATKLIKEQAGVEAPAISQAGISAPAIIAVTASAFEEERAQVLEAGCDDFVRKPFTDAEIFDKMAQHLGVRYIYEEIEPTPEESDRVVLAPADLAALPDDWLAELRQAATRGRTQQLLDLIEHIEPDHAQVAEALRELVNDLEFKQIVALTGTEEDREGSPN